MSYTGPNFVNGGPPAINAANLNGMVTELERLSPIGDETLDIRTGYNGDTYSSAGNAVRGQAGDIADAVKNTKCVGDNIEFHVIYSKGKKILGNGVIQDDATYSYTNYISCTASTKYFFNESTNIVVVFYNSSKGYISSSNGTSFTTPATAQYFRYSLPTSIVENVKLTKGKLYENYVDFNRKSIKTTTARHYAQLGQTSGAAYFPSVSKAYISGFVAKGFDTYTINYPTTIKIYALYVKNSGSWTQKTVYPGQSIITLSPGDDDVAITFANSTNDSTTLTSDELASIYVCTVNADFSYSKSLSYNYVENYKINTAVNRGERVTLTPASDEWYRYVLLPVKAGEQYRIIGSASSTACRWAVTDGDGVLLFKSISLKGDEIIHIAQNGYLICNTRKNVDFGLYLIGESGFSLATKEKIVNKFSTWNTIPEKPYYIFALDCAKKYFTIENIKTLIDEIAENGFNQLQIQLSTDLGFRMELDDNMTINVGGNSYDLTPCLGGQEAPENWYDIADMDEIISYANSKGLDVSPFIPMPAHMRKILLQFPQFSVTDANYCLDFMNNDAVNFGIEIIKKYARYFASRGCHFYNIGTDEVGAYGNFAGIYSSGKFRQLADFVNLAIQTVKECGLTPRIYNEVVAYENNYEYQISKDAEVLCWKMSGSPFATPNKIQELGYEVVNSSSWYYYIDGSGMSIAPEYLVAVDPLICYGGFSNNFNHPTNGVVMSVWCDQSVTQDPGDGGDAVVSDVLPLIDYFGKAIYNANTKYVE